MPIIDETLLDRITADPNVRFGKPCIRGHRITVQEILEWLSSGASQQQILADYPQLESENVHGQGLQRGMKTVASGSMLRSAGSGLRPSSVWCVMPVRELGPDARSGCARHNGLSPPPRGGEHVKESR